MMDFCQGCGVEMHLRHNPLCKYGELAHIRDQFAMAALAAGYYSNGTAETADKPGAVRCYIIADEMMKEREARQKSVTTNQHDPSCAVHRGEPAIGCDCDAECRICYPQLQPGEK